MIMRWIACGAGNLHIVGPCPECYASEGGLLVGTVANTHKGRVHTVCLDCNMAVDYYTDAKEEKLWKLEPVEAKGATSSNPNIIKEIKAKEPDTQVKADNSEEVDAKGKTKAPALI